MEPITNMDDIIDSRDVLEELERVRLVLDSSPEEIEEHFSLVELIKELRLLGGDTPEDGLTLVRDSYFKKYAQELAEDVGAISSDAQWPLGCIDWEQAARQLQQDYTFIDFGGVGYWFR